MILQSTFRRRFTESGCGYYVSRTLVSVEASFIRRLSKYMKVLLSDINLSVLASLYDILA